MGSINISYFGVFLVFVSGWLMVGWPLYVTTMHAHGGISHGFALKAATVGVVMGMCLIGIALKFPIFVILFTSIMSGIATFIGMFVGLKRDPTNK